MEYTVKKLSQISGISARTLRYYDGIGLLCPARVSNGYRVYSANEVEILQQILFYRELGYELSDIKSIITSKDFDRLASLKAHLLSLEAKKQQLEMLISNVKKTIESEKGDIIMTDKEKFEGFKREKIEENEKKYGKELRERYGDDIIDGSRAKVLSMTEEKWNHQQELNKKISTALCEAVKTGNPASPEAQKLCELHREWLCMFWKDGTYTKEKHKALGEGYVADERFKSYYDAICVGGAEFLRDALNNYCK